MSRWLVWFAVPSVALAAPVEVTWQGRLLDATGNPVQGAHVVRVRLWDTPTGTDTVNDLLHGADYTLTVADGYANVVLGATGNLDSAVFAGDVWVGVTLDPATGGVEMSPRAKVTDTPSATVGGAGLRLGLGGTCDATTFGTLQFDATANALQICSGGTWVTISKAFATNHTITLHNGARRWSNGSYAQSCDQYRTPTGNFSYLGDTGDGLYWIEPPGYTAFQVLCDMTFENRGWTMVARGVGASGTGWLTTGDLNLQFSTGTSGTFKLADAKINAIPKVMYRWVGAGATNQDWYWNAALCPTYAHTTTASGGCNRSHSTSALSDPRQGADSGGHMGLGDWTGASQDHLHTAHTSGFWYNRDVLSDENGAVCNGTQLNCNVWLYVR
jgi:hypothetical protein